MADDNITVEKAEGGHIVTSGDKTTAVHGDQKVLSAHVRKHFGIPDSAIGAGLTSAGQSLKDSSKATKDTRERSPLIQPEKDDATPSPFANWAGAKGA